MTDLKSITPIDSKNIRLTQTVQKGGCAAKVAATELRKILSQVVFPESPKELLIGSATFDDAAVYKINEKLALVQTLDFFTPIVDSPKLFGQIAAANALSDVYAMGGKPVTAMAIFAFPLATLDNNIAIDVLQGASDVISKSGAALVGGHTIDDDTMKFGLSVTGFVDPEQVWSNANAKAGDVLILTKAIGTGTLTAALKRGEVNEEQISDGIASMCQLNNVLDFIDTDLLKAIHAATDITGFGLAGHAYNMAKASGVSFEIQSKNIPRFERALEFIEKGFLTKAHRTNAEYVIEHLSCGLDIAPTMKQLIFDPQTSGGLLLSVDPKYADQIVSCLQKTFLSIQKIGFVEEKNKYALQLA
jgi:selenide, water dikinase